MRVGVIGAGLSGLVAARDLVASGLEVTIFEKSRGLGGRIATRRVDSTVIDDGVPALWSSGPLAELAAGLDEAPLEISLPVGDSSGAPSSGPRPLAYPGGLTRLPKQLAEGLDVRRLVRVSVMRASGDAIELGDEQGNGQGAFDGVVISAPAPQAADLLATLDSERARAGMLGAIAYEPAVIYIAGLVLPAHPPWFGVRGLGDGALSWLGVESAKGRPAPGGRVPVTAHLNATLSAELFDATDAEIAEVVRPRLVEALGQAASDPAWSQVKRWRYSVPTSRVPFVDANPAGSAIVVCGDAVADEPGLDAVLESGRRAAQRIAAT
ncbi:MAG: FAD-dependent oxidoreductase [Thermoleophilia bacterium]|nr:FAD-dependent oxidoreductase [Thermoleophilia bacterium]